MKSMLSLLLVLFSLAALPAQNSSPAGEPARAGEAIDGLRVSLQSDTTLVDKAGEIIVRLTIDVVADGEYDQALLTGNLLQAFDGDKERFQFRDAPAGKVKLTAGTQITRPITVDLVPIFGGDTSATTIAEVVLRWPGTAAEVRLMVAPNQADIDLEKLDYAKTRVLLKTSEGDITLGFRPDKAPNHVRNFVKLAKTGFYDDTQFHRVIRDFMIQGGCPNTKPGADGMPGTGNPGWTVNAEFNDIIHERGVLSAARSQDPNSAGSQFFLMHGRAPHLDGQYTAYGRVESGLEVVDKIATTPVGGPQGSTPRKPMHLHRAIVLPVYAQ